MHPYILSKHKEIIDRTCLSCGQQQQWEAVPPYQLLVSAQTATPQDPELALVSLAGTRCSKVRYQSSTQY